jgi:hypothetical protein
MAGRIERMIIRAWMQRLSGLTVCLTVGCVFHHASRDLPPTSTGAPPTPEIVHSTKGPSVSEMPSPRHETTTRSAATIDPPESDTASLPVGADLLPAEAPVKMSPTPEPEVGPPPAAAAPPPPAPSPATKEKLPPLAAALRSVLNKHPEQAARELEGVDTPRRDRLLALLRLAVDLEEQSLDRLSPAEVDATLEHLHALSRQLRPRAPLKIQTACLCQTIQGFGQYERITADHAYPVGAAGKPGGRVQVYAEVGNFASKPVGEGRHETSLATALEVEDASGKVVSTMNLGTCADQSQSPRSDYYLNFQFPVPASLEPGDYTLRIIVKDVTAGPPREARTTLPLRVRSAK